MGSVVSGTGAHGARVNGRARLLIGLMIGALGMVGMTPASANVAGAGAATCVALLTPHRTGDPDAGCPWITVPEFPGGAQSLPIGGHVTVASNGLQEFTIDGSLQGGAAGCPRADASGVLDLTQRVAGQVVWSESFSVSFQRLGTVAIFAGLSLSDPAGAFLWVGRMAPMMDPSLFVFLCAQVGDQGDASQWTTEVGFEFQELTGIHTGNTNNAGDLASMIIDEASWQAEPGVAVGVALDPESEVDKLIHCSFGLDKPKYKPVLGEIDFGTRIACPHKALHAWTRVDLFRWIVDPHTHRIEEEIQEGAGLEECYVPADPPNVPECGLPTTVVADETFPCAADVLRCPGTYLVRGEYLVDFAPTVVWLNADPNCQQTSPGRIQCLLFNKFKVPA